MNEEILKKIQELGTAFEAYKKANDERMAQMETKGSVDPMVEEKVNKANADVDKLDKELADMKAAFNRQSFQPAVDEKVAFAHEEYKGKMPGLFDEKGQYLHSQSMAYKEAFNKFCKKDKDGLTPEEMKLLSVGSDPDGGYLVRPERASEIVKKIFESSPVRAVASAQTISSSSLIISTDLDECGSGWVGEQESRTETDTPEVGEKEIFVHELYAKPLATQSLLDDASTNMESWLAEKVSEKFARDEATAFVNGDGVKKPRGFMTYPAGTSTGEIEQVASGSATTLTADGLISLVNALKQGYRGNASFMMQRATVGVVRKLKGSDNNYLWQPGLQANVPSTLLGAPIYEAADMATVAGAALPIAYGDFRMGYQILDRIGIRTLRDPYSSKPKVEFYTTKRVGGDVKNYEAIKIQVVST